MHKVFFSLVASLSVLVGLTFSSVALAQEQPASGSQPTLVATVNIQNAKIVSQQGNTFTIAFTITNDVIPQTGVLYSVLLVGKTAQGAQFVADQKVYPDSVALPEHSQVHKEISYTAPSALDGQFDVVLQSKNAAGFPFGVAKVATVTLTSTGGVELLGDSCYLTVVGQKTTAYNLTQGVDIAPTESLALHCAAQNHGSAISVFPQFETHYRTPYGEIVSAQGGDTDAISFAAQEKKDLVIILPKARDPQAYDTIVRLGESNPVDAHYVIQGDSATIQNLSLDKTYYQKGDEAILSFLWAPSADTFPGSRRYADEATSTASSTTGLTATIGLADSAGAPCGDTLTQQLSVSMPPVVRFPITHTCSNPHLSVDIKDGAGKILAHRELVLISPKTYSSKTIEIAGALVLCVLAVAAGLYAKKTYA